MQRYLHIRATLCNCSERSQIPFLLYFYQITIKVPYFVLMKIPLKCFQTTLAVVQKGLVWKLSCQAKILKESMHYHPSVEECRYSQKSRVHFISAACIYTIKERELNLKISLSILFRKYGNGLMCSSCVPYGHRHERVRSVCYSGHDVNAACVLVCQPVKNCSQNDMAG